MWTFCACPAWCWIPHPHTSSQTQAYGVWLKLLTDGRGKKGAFFFFKPLLRTGPNWIDISVLWTHLCVLSDAVRMAFSKKRYVWRKKGLCMFALSGLIFPEIFVTKIDPCTRMSAIECWDLPSCVQKWKSKARPRIKARKIETVASNT